MRVLNPLRLFLAFSFTLAGCAQEPQQRTLVIGGSDIANPLATVSGGTGSTVVTNGFDIPPTDLGRRPCRLNVKLRGVYYGGNDVGHEWRFTISVNNRSWVSNWRTMLPGTWDIVDERLWSGVVEHGCGGLQPVTIFVRARERDWGIFDDTGQGLDSTLIPCPEKMFRQTVVMKIPVPENHGNSWRFFLGKYPKIALLHFVFEVTAQCE